MENLFKKGDVVTITKPGKIYANFKQMFIHFKFLNSHYNNIPENYRDLTWTVFEDLEIHPFDSSITLVPIQSDDGHQILIGSSGIDLVEFGIYKMIPTEEFWKGREKGKYMMENKTLVLVEGESGHLKQDFAYVMNGFFDHHRQGLTFKKDSIKFVLVKK